MSAARLLLLALLAQPAPKGQPFDPILPSVLLPVVERASQAELDPKRGPSNAVQILEAERAKLAADEALNHALMIRVAVVKLRDRFLTVQEFKPEMRWMQALSTYAKLELNEPGFGAWVERTINNVPEAKKQIAKKSARTIRAALLIRGSAIERKALVALLKRSLEKAGASFEEVPLAKAPYVLTFSAEDAPALSDGRRAVKVSAGLEESKEAWQAAAPALKSDPTAPQEKQPWSTGVFRVEAAPESAVALSAALDGVVRIAGRELLFHWLGHHGLPMLLDPTPRSMTPGFNPGEGPGGHPH